MESIPTECLRGSGEALGHRPGKTSAHPRSISAICQASLLDLLPMLYVPGRPGSGVRLGKDTVDRPLGIGAWASQTHGALTMAAASGGELAQCDEADKVRCQSGDEGCW